jgi:hypothetical protein
MSCSRDEHARTWSTLQTPVRCRWLLRYESAASSSSCSRGSRDVPMVARWSVSISSLGGCHVWGRGREDDVNIQMDVAVLQKDDILTRLRSG